MRTITVLALLLVTLATASANSGSTSSCATKADVERACDRDEAPPCADPCPAIPECPSLSCDTGEREIARGCRTLTVRCGAQSRRYGAPVGATVSRCRSITVRLLAP